MKNKGTKIKLLASILVIVLVIVCANIPFSSTYSDDSIKDMKTYKNMSEYISATSELLTDYPCDFNETLSLNVDANTVEDKNGERNNNYNEVISSALQHNVEEATKLLTENGYEVVDSTHVSVKIKDPYQTKRIIVISDNLTNGYNATKIIHYGNEYVLQFETIEDTQIAFMKLKKDKNVIDAFLDLPVDLNENDDSYEDLGAFYPVEDDDFVNGKKDHYSWGVTTMGLDVLQDRLIEANPNPPEIVVAVIDSGVNYYNKYLENRILSGYNFIADNENIMDDNGHGTHVAGIVCDGTSRNVKILPIKSLDSKGNGSILYVRAGILFAIEHQAKVVNLSLSAIDTSGKVKALESTFDYAHENNCIICVSAGNDSSDTINYYPSRSPKVFTVSAIDNTQELAYYSNYGDAVDFGLPGSSIISTYKNGLAYKSGTSMSTPHLTAAIALLKTWNPNITFEEAEKVLTKYTIDLGTPGKDPMYGHGMLNLANMDLTKKCNHEYIENITKQPTCTDKGVKTYECKHCHESYTEEIPALGHKMEIETVLPTCTEKGYTISKCSRCGYETDKKIIEATGHNYISTEKVPATCEKSGLIEFRCQYCGDTYTEEIPALGHKYSSMVIKEPTHTEDGQRKYICSLCGKFYLETIPKEVHNFTVTTVPPTCTEQGYDEYKCDCGYSYKENYVDALGHDFKITKSKEASCTEQGVIVEECSRCKETKTTNIPPKGHTFAKEVHEPNCTEQGFTRYSCSTCGYTEDKDFIEALGHDYHETVVSPTCESKGYTLHTCSRCNDSYKDNYTEKLEHEYSTTIINPTCTKDGKIIYTCKNCGYTYSKVLKSKGHSLQTIKTDPTCTKDGEKKVICSLCGYVAEVSTIPALGHKIYKTVVPPTCTEKGYTLEACERCDYAKKSNFVDTIPHNFVFEEQIDATCGKEGKKISRCSACGEKHIEIIPALEHNFKTEEVKPTCTEKGYTLKTCTREGCTFSEKTDFLEPLGHNYTSKITTPATCEKAGIKTFTCSRCGDTYTEEIPALEHKYSSSKVEPTCQHEGYTLYTCENCGKTYKEDIIPKIDHSYEESIKTNPTCHSKGEKLFTCKYCGETYTEEIPMTEHNFKAEKVEPTCQHEGYTLYKCTNPGCSESYKEDIIPKTEHKYIKEITKAPTCDEEGKATFTCEYCKHSYEEEIPELDHEYKTEVVVPTCKDKGYTLHICTRCGKSYKDQFTEKVPHDYKVKSQKEPTCKEPGETIYECSFCGKLKKTKIPTVPHQFISKITKDPTCVRPGEITHTCKFCGISYKEHLPPLAHNYEDTIVAPTCQEKGYTLHKCTKCGRVERDNYVDVVPHDYEETVVAPTCQEKGYTLHKCKYCGEEFKDNYLDPIPHDYEETVVAPTCQEKGYTLHKCKSCGYEFKDNYVDPVGHDYEQITTKEPNCKSPGEIKYTCKNCGHSYTEEIPTTDHHFKTNIINPTCKTEGYTEYICNDCGYSYKDNIVPKLDHKISDWIVDKEASCEESGSKHKECLNCGEIIETIELPALGHNYEVTTIKPTNTLRGYDLHTCKNCGHQYKDNYVNCNNQFINTLYVTFDKIKLMFDSFWGF